MKTTNDSPPPKPGATPESDRNARKFAHESQEKTDHSEDQENADRARRELQEIQTKTLEQLELEFPPEIIPGLLYKGRRAMVTGKPFDGKGLLLIQMACCVATGEEFLGFKIPKPMKVFIGDFELLEPQLKQRIEGFIKVTAKDNSESEKRLRALISENLKVACYLRKRHWLHHPEAFNDIARRAKSHKSELIVLDPGWRLRKSEMVEADIHAFLAGLDVIEKKTGASLVYAQHQGKGSQEGKAVAERFSGRYDFARDAATVLTLTNDDSLPEGCFKAEARTNDFAQPDPFHVLREYPLFRRVSSWELKALSKPAKRLPTMDDFIRLVPPSITDLDGTGPQEILNEKLYLLAADNEPRMGERKVDKFKKTALADGLIKTRDEPRKPGELGRGPRFWSKAQKGAHYEFKNFGS